MGRAWRYGAIVFGVFVVLVVSPLVVAGSMRKQDSAPGSAVSTGTSADAAKVSSSLVAAARRGSKTRRLAVVVLTARHAARPAALERALAVRLAADPRHRLWVGSVQAGFLTKLAASRGVVRVYDDGRRAAPPSPERDLARAPDRSTLARRAALARRADEGTTGPGSAPRRTTARRASAGVAARSEGRDPRTDWGDVGPVHKSSAAWAKGYTGSGVKVAVADDGIDFGHPDLAGTYARITDPASAYNGWPMAYDPYSMSLYAEDRYLNTTSVASGRTWYVDTATMVTASSTGTAVFNGQVYRLPNDSVSGVYHLGEFPDENLVTLRYGEPVAVCVVDGTTSGSYDRVYVDLDDDYDFTDEIAQRKGAETAVLDFWNSAGATEGPDGYSDLSAGTLYYIADGAHHPPGFDWIWRQYDANDNPLPLPAPLGAGNMVAFMGAMDLEGDHGTLCGSAVAAQGVVNGNAPPYKLPGGAGTGMVQGGGRDVDLVAIGNVYNNHFLSSLLSYDFAALGPDGVEGSGDEVQIVSNSYADSADDADALDYRSRYVTLLGESVATRTAFLFSTGNGGPGLGTNAPPSPATGISVGASTLFGSVGTSMGVSVFDSIETASQMTFGDVIPFSSRGPTAMGDLAPHVVADGAFGSGDLPLSMVGDGWMATAAWGGTSRATPIAAGNLALVMQAFKGRTGYFPTAQIARDFLMSGATDLGYDPLSQGAGMVDADRSVDLAAGRTGAFISPSEWTAGDYRGVRFGSFPKVVPRGSKATTVFSVANPSPGAVDVTVSDEVLHRTGQRSLSVAANLAAEDPYALTRPDYLVDIGGLVPSDCDLVVARVTQPFSSFDPNGDYAGTGQVADNSFNALLYDWTDRNGNGRLWQDANGNGAVNVGEIDAGEYMRFTYSNAVGPSHEVKLRRPAGRYHNGLFVGLQHRWRDPGVATTPISVTLDFYKATDWGWLSGSKTAMAVPARTTATFTATLAVPADAGPGTYAGSIVLTQGGRRTVVPVTANVEATSTDFSFGGSQDASMEAPQSIHGLGDWSGGPDAGDWRFAFTDIPDKVLLEDGTRWLARTTWQSVPTDLDTLVFGPTADDFTGEPDDAMFDLFGPYALSKVGGSPNTNFVDTVIGDTVTYVFGKWRYDTSTGGSQDIVSAPVDNGLNLFAVHDVLYAGTSPTDAFRTDVGTIITDPASLDIASRESQGDVAVSVKTGLPLAGLTARAYGLVRPTPTRGLPIADESTWEQTVTLTGVASFDVAIGDSPNNDIDLYVSRWDGSRWAQLGASEGPTDEEHVDILGPQDGAYLVEVIGFSVSPSPATFDMTTTAIQGTGAQALDLPSGAVAAGATKTFKVHWSNDWAAMSTSTPVLGMLFLGPPDAPRALAMPITLSYGTSTKTSLAVSPAIVLASKAAKVTGTVTPAPPGGQVALDERPWTTAKWTPVATVTPGATGRFSLSRAPLLHTYYRARYTGSGLFAASRSKAATVQVRDLVTLTIPKKMKRGRRYWFRAGVRPGHPTQSLRIERYYNRKWRLFKTVRPYNTVRSQDGVALSTWYKLKVKLAKRGAYRFRAVFRDGDGWHLPYMGGAKRVVVR